MPPSQDFAEWLRDEQQYKGMLVKQARALCLLAARQHEALKSVLVENDKVVAALREAEDFQERYFEC